MLWRKLRVQTPDQRLYPSAKEAMQVPRETPAYVAVIDPGRWRLDARIVLDVDPQSTAYSQGVGRLELPHVGDDLHQPGWWFPACGRYQTEPASAANRQDD
jgi:hypothetical protein